MTSRISIIYLILNLFAVLLGGLSMFLLLRKQKVEKRQALAFVSLLCIGALIFGTTVSLDFEKRIISVGFDSLRAVAGVGVVLVVLYFTFRKCFDAILRAVILSLPLMYGFAKIGCTVAGCCHGILYDGPFALTGHDGARHFPIQPLESIVFLLIYVLGLAVYIWKKEDPLQLVVWFSLVSKFALDFLRAERSGVISRNQILIIVYLVVWLVCSLALARRKTKK